MSMSYIRSYYGVPAKRGARVCYHPPGCEPREGTIVASDRQYIKVRLDGDTRPLRLHPTWEITYLAAGGGAS